MKIRLYLNDWFYNMGLVGLMRAFKFASIPYTAKENYLEFDSQYLEGLQYIYFRYLILNYDFEGLYIERFNRYINGLKNGSNLEKVYDNIDKLIKNLIKNINDEKYIRIINEYYNQFKKTKKNIKNNIDKIINILTEITKMINEEELRLQLTFENIKNEISNYYFGQVSFLNSNYKSSNIDEISQKLYMDYIFPIIFDEIFKCYLNNKDEEIFNIIKNEKLINEKINKKRLGFYQRLTKNSSIELIKQKIEEKYPCLLCNDNKSYDQNYSESMFLALGVSNDETMNFFWNYITKIPICDTCKLVLLFSPLGTTKLITLVNNKKREIRQAFVNLDTDINTLFDVNETFKYRTSHDNPYKELILDIIQQYKQKAIWTLQNILFVEFYAKYREGNSITKKSRLYYYNLPHYLVEFFKQYAQNTLSYIYDYSFRNSLIESIIKQGSLDKEIFIKLQNNLKNGGRSSDVFNAVLTKCFINYCKKKIRSDDKVIYYKIRKIYDSGIELYNYLKSNNQENKINSIAYRILNAAKVGNKKELMDTLLRLYINAGKNIPKEFLDIFNQREVDTESLAQAFVAGLTSQNVNAQDNEKIQEEDEIDE